ncbi:MAG: hypothetical protein HYY17_12300 [Planctomycetes bacterium]|nr:hypothetical protein [Planctomycetota bacterium]
MNPPEEAPVENVYLKQVQAQQAVLADELQAKKGVAAPGAPPPWAQEHDTRTGLSAALRGTGPATTPPIEVRVTGWWRWKTVIVPPNAYVVHTRRGRKEPVTTGLGISFGYDPYKDSFLVAPSAMQTVLISANCICRELQGILVQGYVQWIIHDFSVAYKRLDFSDAIDPMRIVNVQLREQAEAAIKDKVATMSIHEVLSDKQPIIDELTARLRSVAEGSGTDNRGLGLRIVTVQIKEAVVSSARVWENMQKPFRAERERIARLAQLETESTIRARELEAQKAQETAAILTRAEIEKHRATQEAAKFDRDQGEKLRRQNVEEEAARRSATLRRETQQHELEAKRLLEESTIAQEEKLKAARLEAKQREFLLEAAQRMAQEEKEKELAASAATLEKARIEIQTDLIRSRAAQDEVKTTSELKLEEARLQAANRQAEREVALEGARQKVANDVSSNHLQSRLIETLPAIAEKLPAPKELRSVTFGSAGNGQEGSALASLVGSVLAVLDAYGVRTRSPKAEVS